MKKRLLSLTALLMCLATILMACGEVDPASLTVKNDAFTLTNGVYVAEVGADVTEMNILEAFEVNEGYTLAVYSDSQLTQAVTGAVSIGTGTNTFYVQATPTGDGDARTFTVRITRTATYTVTFTDGETTLGTATVTAGSLVAASDIPTPEKPGYTFTGWNNFVATEAPTASVTATAVFVARTDTAYKVEYYKQNVSDDEYTLEETENLVGTTDTVVSYVAKNYPGYSVDTTAGVLSGTIAGDGSLVLKVYYNRATVPYTVETYVENTANNSYSLEGTSAAQSGDYGTTVTISPEARTGFEVDTTQSVLSGDLELNGNVFKVYYKRVRSVVTFKTDASDDGVTRTAKYGVGLVDENGTAVTEPVIEGEATQGKEFVWAEEGSTDRINYANLTAAVTLFKTERDIAYDIAFTLPDADWTADGYAFDNVPSKTQFTFGESIEINVEVDTQYNKSEFYFNFTPAGGGNAVRLDPVFDGENAVYTLTYSVTESGTISFVGEIARNTYNVSGKLVLFGGGWANINTVRQASVTIQKSDAPTATPITVEEDGTFSADLENGIYTITVTEPSGRSVSKEIAFNATDWEAIKLQGEALGEIVVGMANTEDNLTKNFDGTIKTNPTVETHVLFDGLDAAEFAVTVTAEFVEGTESDPGLCFRLWTRETSISVVLMRANLRIFHDWNDHTNVGHGISGIWTKNEPFTYTLVKSSDAIILYYSTDGKNTIPFARITATTVDIYTAGTSYSTHNDLNAAITAILANTNTVSFGTTVNTAGNATGEITYTNYAYRTRNISGTVSTTEPVAADGTIAVSVSGTEVSGETEVVLGKEVAVTVTPVSGKMISLDESSNPEFMVSIDGGSATSVATESFGTLTGSVITGYTFTFVVINTFTYEFSATFVDRPAEDLYKGKVVEKDDSTAAVSGASVAVYNVVGGERGALYETVSTNNNGEFEISFISGTYELEITKGSYYKNVVSNLTVEASNTERDETATPIALKYMKVGGTVEVADTTYTSDLTGINATYDYESSTERIGTDEKIAVGDKTFVFTDFTATDAVVKYTVTLDEMVNHSSNREYWPGIGIDIYNGNGNKNYKLLRNGAVGSDLGNRYEYSTIDITGSATTRELSAGVPNKLSTVAHVVDVMFVKQGAYVYAFSKRPTDTNYGLVFTFQIFDAAFLSTPLAYGIRLSANAAQYCMVEYTNISISGESSDISAALEGIKSEIFDRMYNDQAVRQSGTTFAQQMADGGYKIGSNGIRAVSTAQAYSDFVVSATFITDAYDVHGTATGANPTGEGSANWHNLGFAIATTSGDDVFLLGQVAHSIRIWNKWNFEFAKSDNSAALAADATIVKTDTDNGGISSFPKGAEMNFTVIRKGQTLYFVRNGIYLAKIALEDNVVNLYYANGTKATDYDFYDNSGTVKVVSDALATSFKNILTAESVYLGIGGHGGAAFDSGVKDYSVKTGADVDNAITEINGLVTNSITINDGENGDETFTVGGNAYVAGTTVTAGNEVTLTIAPTYASGITKYRVSSLKVAIDGNEATDVTYTAGAEQSATYTFTPKQGESYVFTVEYEAIAAVNTITGTVKDIDYNWKLLEGIEVIVTSVPGGIEYTATTDASGAFSIVLVSGEYTISYAKGSRYYFGREGANITIEATPQNEETPVALPEMLLKESPVGGDTTLSDGTVVHDPNKLTAIYDYNNDAAGVRVESLDNKTGAVLNANLLNITGLKNPISMVSFTYELRAGGTETDAGIGFYFATGDGWTVENTFAPVFRKGHLRVARPWVSAIPSGDAVNTSGFTVNTVGSYDLRVIRINTDYYMLAKPSSAPNYELVGKLSGAQYGPAIGSNEAAVGIAMTVGDRSTHNFVLSNFEVKEDYTVEDYIRRNRIEVWTLENWHGNVTVTGDGVTGDAAAVNAKAWYMVPMGNTASFVVTPDEGYILDTFTAGGKTCVPTAPFHNYGGGTIEIYATFTPLVMRSVTGAMTADSGLTGFTAGEGNGIIYFTRFSGEVYEGVVTRASESALNYSISLPAGTYTKVNYLGFTTGNIVVSEDGTYNLNFTGAEYSVVTNGGLVNNGDGTLQLNTRNGNTQESAMPKASFNPSKQVLTFGYTLTNMVSGHGNPLAGMFIKGASGGMIRVVNSSVGDQMMLMGSNDWTSRMQIADGDHWLFFGTPTNWYSFGKVIDEQPYALTVKYIFDGYKFAMFVKRATDTNWITITEEMYDVEERYQNGIGMVDKAAGSQFIDSFYKLDEECVFGPSFRRDATYKNDDTGEILPVENNDGIYSNMWYSIEDRSTESVKFEKIARVSHSSTNVTETSAVGADKISTTGALFKNSSIGVDDDFMVRTTLYSSATDAAKAGINLEYNGHGALFGYEKERNRIYVVQQDLTNTGWTNYRDNKFAITGLPTDWNLPDGTDENAIEMMLIKKDGEYYMFAKKLGDTEWTVAQKVNLANFGTINNGTADVTYDFKYRLTSGSAYSSTATSMRLGVAVASSAVASTFGNSSCSIDSAEIAEILAANYNVVEEVA